MQPVRSHLAEDAHREPRAGERLSPHELIGEAQLGPEAADLVLEQVAQRLEQLEAHVLRKPADIVVGLDRRARAPMSRD